LNPVRTPALDKDLARKRVKAAREAALRPPKPPKPPPEPIPKLPKLPNAFDQMIGRKAMQILQTEGLIPAMQALKQAPAPVKDDAPPGYYGNRSHDIHASGSTESEFWTNYKSMTPADVEKLQRQRDEQEAANFPGRPPKGKKMNLWTAEELAAEKKWLQRVNKTSTPSFDDRPYSDPQWFARACANRNNRGF
jgi:hypothetical protein